MDTLIERPQWLPERSWPWSMHALDTPVGRIAVTDVGDGPTLLFVHVGTWSFVWRDVLLRLQGSLRCVTVDAPGCGLSERGVSTLATAGDAVTAVIDALGLRDIVLVAHDLGGPVGFLAASRRPDRIAGLCAVNCFAWRPTGALFRGMLALMGSTSVRRFDGHVGWLAAATSTRFGVGRRWDAQDRAAFRAGIDRDARLAWHDYFADARNSEVYPEVEVALAGPLASLPLTTIFGQFNDPLRLQSCWKVRFPNAVQIQVPRGNHFPMCDDPDLVAQALTSIVTKS